MHICPDCRAPLDNNTLGCSSCRWVREKNQGLDVYLSTADKRDSFFRAYLDNYNELAANDLLDNIVDGTYLLSQAKKLAEYSDRLRASNILDVGVGQGYLIACLLQRYHAQQITVVDIAQPFLRHVQERYSVRAVVANAENLPFVDEFDLAFASDILEHVINPIDFLLSLNRSLIIGGHAILRVPFMDNMLQYSRALGGLYQFAHLRNFCAANLLDMVRQAGFHSIHVTYDGFHSYRRRKIFRHGWLKKQFDAKITKYYHSELDLNGIPNWLGRILMKPLEIVVVLRKARNVTSVNDSY